jgi:hypothetical protein
VRIEILREPGSDKRVIRVSEWAAMPLGWFPAHGVSVGSLRELFSLIVALLKSFVALRLTSNPTVHPDQVIRASAHDNTIAAAGMLSARIT